METKLLKSKMVLAGKSPKDLCRAAGIGESTFYKKLRGVSDFTKPEIEAIAREIGLNREEVMDIFFPDMVA